MAYITWRSYENLSDPDPFFCLDKHNRAKYPYLSPYRPTAPTRASHTHPSGLAL